MAEVVQSRGIIRDAGDPKLAKIVVLNYERIPLNFGNEQLFLYRLKYDPSLVLTEIEPYPRENVVSLLEYVRNEQNRQTA